MVLVRPAPLGPRLPDWAPDRGCLAFCFRTKTLLRFWRSGPVQLDSLYLRFLALLSVYLTDCQWARLIVETRLIWLGSAVCSDCSWLVYRQLTADAGGSRRVPVALLRLVWFAEFFSL